MSKETLEVLFSFIEYISTASKKELIILKHEVACKKHLLSEGISWTKK